MLILALSSSRLRSKRMLQFFLATVFFFSLQTIQAANPSKKCVESLTAQAVRIVHSDSKSYDLSTYEKKLYDVYLKNKGLYNLPLGTIMGSKGGAAVWGYKMGLENILPNKLDDVGFLKEVGTIQGTDKITVNPTNSKELSTVQFLPSSIGSFLKSQYSEDIDMEMTLLYTSKDFTYEAFKDAKHPIYESFIQSIIKFIESKLADGLEFADFKAGQYDYIPANKQKTKSRSIKWSLEEIKQGYKIGAFSSPDSQNEKLTLAEALTQDARVKLDFFIKVPNTPDIQKKTGVKEWFKEVSFFTMLAGRKPNAPPILKVSTTTQLPDVGATGPYVSIKDKAYMKPLRVGTYFFNPEHLALTRQMLFTTQYISSDYLNFAYTNSAIQYLKTDKIYKGIKMLKERLKYWPDFQYFLAGLGNEWKKVSTKEFIDVVEKIINRPDILEYKKWIDMFETEKDLPQHGSYFRDIQRLFKETNSELAQTAEDLSISYSEVLEMAINIELEKEIASQPLLLQAINYIKGLGYLKAPSLKKSRGYFISLVPSETLIQKYEVFLKRLREKYPHIQFKPARDIHMTMLYLGSLSDDELPMVKNYVAELQNKVQNFNFELKNPDLELVGKHNKQLALTFREATSKGFENLVKSTKAKLYNDLGVLEYRNIDHFLPHFSIAFFEASSATELESKEFYQLMTEDLSDFFKVNINELEVKVQKVKEDSSPHELDDERYEDVF